MTSLHTKVRAGLIWSTIQNWSIRLSGLLLFMFMTRLLSQDQIGLFAAASVVLALTGLLAEQGLGEAVVQTQHISEEQLNCVFWLNLGLALLLAGALWILAPTIAAWMNLPTLTDVLRVTSVTVPIAAAAFSQTAMNKREFRYKWLAQVNLASIVVAGVIAVALAAGGFGVWSLVAQSVVGATCVSVMLLARPQWKLSRRVDMRGTRSLVSYGSYRLASNLLDFASTRYIDVFLVATVGPVALAVYTVGTKVYQALMQTLSASILDVVLNGFSRLAADREALLAAYYRSVTLTATVAVPAFCLVAAVAPSLTVVLFGEKWLDSAEVMRFMSALAVVQVVQFYNVTLYNAMGKPRVGLVLMVVKIAVTALALYLARNDGLTGILMAFVASQLAITPINFYLLRRLVGVSLRRLAGLLWPFFAASALMVTTVVFFTAQLSHAPIGNLLRLLALSACGGLTYLATVRLLAPSALNDTLSLIKRPRAT